MKSFLVAGTLLSMVIAAPAFAADMAVKAPPRQAAPPAANWTGLYIGANVGAAWARTQWIDTGTSGALDAAYTAPGPLAGGQIGFNYQIQNVVVGIEGEWDWSNLKGSGSCFPFPGAAIQTCGTGRVRDIATVTGRLGAVWNDALLYVKGGGAWMRADYFNSCPDCGGPVGGVAEDWLASETRAGWTAGVGVEYALSSNWSAKLEYDYIGLPDRTLLFVPLANPASGQFTEVLRENIQTVKLGVNYRFNLGHP